MHSAKELLDLVTKITFNLGEHEEGLPTKLSETAVFFHFIAPSSMIVIVLAGAERVICRMRSETLIL
jgi:hypothetical protein